MFLFFLNFQLFVKSQPRVVRARALRYIHPTLAPGFNWLANRIWEFLCAFSRSFPFVKVWTKLTVSLFKSNEFSIANLITINQLLFDCAALFCAAPLFALSLRIVLIWMTNKISWRSFTPKSYFKYWARFHSSKSIQHIMFHNEWILFQNCLNL